jgi:CheY-like chemotaxis protein
MPPEIVPFAPMTDAADTATRLPLLVIADPEAERRAHHAELLRQAHYDVLALDSAADAIVRAAESVPALIILQLVNPTADGFADCRLVRTTADTRHTPVLVLTRFDDPYTRDQLVRSGATAILAEPLEQTLLLRQVRRLLAHANGRRGR